MPNPNAGRLRLDGGLEYEVPQEVVVAVDKLRADNQDLTNQLQTSTGTVQRLEGERDTLKARVDGFAAELDKARADAKALALTELETRATLEKAAGQFKVDCAGKSDRQIREEVIRTVRTDAVFDGKSDEYVQAAFDMAVSMRDDAAMAAQRTSGARTDDTGTPAEGSYKGFMNQLGKDK